MNPRTTLAWLIVLAALGGYVYFFEIRGANQEGEISLQIYETTYNEYDFVGFEIVGPQSTAHFARTDDTLTQDWQMLLPTPFTAAQLDQSRINGASTRLASLTASQVITAATDLAQYGLDPPSLTATLTISNGEKITLYTGARAPVDDSRYLRIKNKPLTVYLVFGFAVDDLYRLLEEPPLKQPISSSITGPASTP